MEKQKRFTDITLASFVPDSCSTGLARILSNEALKQHLKEEQACNVYPSDIHYIDIRAVACPSCIINITIMYP